MQKQSISLNANWQSETKWMLPIKPTPTESALIQLHNRIIQTESALIQALELLLQIENNLPPDEGGVIKNFLDNYR
jgi:hypothetical protein